MTIGPNEVRFPIDAQSRVMITGATGYIGTWLVKRAVDSGARVRAVSLHGTLRQPPGFRWQPDPFQSDRLEVEDENVVDADAMHRMAEGCTHIFHLAGLAQVWARDPRAFFRVNVDGTRNVLAAAKAAGARRVVCTSSAATLGATEPGTPHNETTPRLSDRPFHDYEASKLEAERVAVECAANGQDVVIVNPTRVYGPGQLNESNALPLLIADYLSGRMPLLINRGVNVGNYVFVDDLIEGQWAAMERGRGGQRYLLGGENVSMRELADTVDELSGRKHFRISVGRWLPMTFAYLQMAGTPFGIPPRITPGWMRMYMADGAFDSSKATRELGFAPRPFSEGLRILWNWMGKVRPTKDHKRVAREQEAASKQNSSAE